MQGSDEAMVYLGNSLKSYISIAMLKNIIIFAHMCVGNPRAVVWIFQRELI
jgi:hypothetical protein